MTAEHSVPPASEKEMPYALTREHLDTAPKEWVINEVLRLRKLLDECWAAAGLLGSAWTGQPWQAWEEPTDLIPQIDDLYSDSQSYRESQKETP